MGNAQGGAIARAPKSLYQGSWADPITCGRPRTEGNLSPSFSSVDLNGNLYTVVAGLWVVYKLPVGSTDYELFAGIPGPAGNSVDGHRLQGGTFKDPQAPEAYDPESYSRVWIADRGSHVIRVIEGDQLRTFAGKKETEGYRDGEYDEETGEGPLFSKPTHPIASRKSASIFVYEEGKPRIRLINLKTRSVSTINFSGAGDLLSAPFLKIYYPLHVKYATETVHLLDGRTLKTYKMTISNGAVEQIDPNPADSANEGAAAAGGGVAGADPNTQQLRQAGIHISPGANIQISPGANVMIGGRPLVLGGANNGAAPGVSSYKVPLPSSDVFHVMATRDNRYQVVDLQYKGQEIVSAPEDASIEWVIAYIPQSNTCIYKLKDGTICAKRNFLSPAPPVCLGTRPPIDLTALLSVGPIIDSDFTLEHSLMGKTTQWALHTAILDATPGLDQNLGALVSYFADTELPASTLNEFVKLLYYDCTTSYSAERRTDFGRICQQVGIPLIDFNNFNARPGLPMKKSIEIHELRSADPEEAANYLNLSTDFAFLTSIHGMRCCIIADGVYAAAQWSWFREQLQNPSNGIVNDRVVTLPSWCTRNIALSIVESLQSVWSTPLDAAEASLIKQHAEELKLLDDGGVPLPVFNAMYSYSP